MTYREAIAEGKRLYAEAMDKAANYALYVSEEFGRPLKTVCREIAPDGWNALDHRARKMVKTAGETPDQRRVRTLNERRKVQRSEAKAALKDPEQAVKVIAALPSEALETVYHEARLARAGEDRTPAHRQAAKAAASNAVAPIKRAVATMTMDLAIQAQREAAEDLREALAEDAITEAAFAKFEKAHAETAEVMAEVRFKLPAGR